MSKIMYKGISYANAGVSSDATSIPTADMTAAFDNTAHMNSTDMTSQEVEDFVDALDGQGANLADYVVEQGTSGIWTYRKWNSGIAECWRAWSSNSAYAGTLANGWYCRDFNGIPFPTDLFIEAPFASFSLYSWNNGYFWGSVRSVSKTAFGIAIFNNSSDSAVANGKIYAIGKWK